MASPISRAVLQIAPGGGIVQAAVIPTAPLDGARSGRIRIGGQMEDDLTRVTFEGGTQCLVPNPCRVFGRI